MIECDILILILIYPTIECEKSIDRSRKQTSEGGEDFRRRRLSLDFSFAPPSSSSFFASSTSLASPRSLRTRTCRVASRSSYRVYVCVCVCVCVPVCSVAHSLSLQCSCVVLPLLRLI